MNGDETAPAPAKVDPESLAIRARPGRAVRFRRGVIVAIAGLSSASLIAVAWLALEPASLQHVLAPEDESQRNGQLPPEALNRLPSSYAETPKLGPPLPGDLGRPILERERALAAGTEQGSQDAAAQAAEAEHERRVAELRAARQSGLLIQGGQGRAAPAIGAADLQSAPPAGAGTSSSGVPTTETVPLGREGDPNAQEQKAAFVARPDDKAEVDPHSLVRPASPNMLSAGSVIPASLITGLRSDIPGLVIAQVTERVYDSPTGQILLIPQGARLIGSYDSVVAFGQRRALIVWQRIIMPDGSSLKIDNVPAADAAGYAGLEDKVDFHTWTLLKGVALSTLLGVGSELALSGDSDLVQAIRQSTQNSSSRAGDQITSRNLGVQPTITIRSGARVRLVVHRDLVLSPWKSGRE